MSRAKYTENELKTAIQNSTSIRQALIFLGLAGKGGNYRVIHRAINKYNIDISHFNGQGWSKNKIIGPKRSIEEYLSNKFKIQSYGLRNRLLKEGILEYVCSNCLLNKWLTGPIPLELDHIDGNHENNNLSNLRLLCPNCHALTDNYRGKNKRKMVGLSGFEPDLESF